MVELSGERSREPFRRLEGDLVDIAVLGICAVPSSAYAGEPIRQYVRIANDTSDDPTGMGPVPPAGLPEYQPWHKAWLGEALGRLAG